jgi:signal transduction histidine kinase/CheY-like chemotaxis protein
MSTECWSELDEGLKLAAQEPTEGSLRVEDAERSTIRAVRFTMTPVRWKRTTTIKVTAIEMTELLEKNRELQEKENSLHTLSARILQLQDEERRRIARDLHDITGQELAVVIMQLMQVARQQRADTESMKGITDAASMLRKIEDEVRTLSYVLHPPLLDELGLGAALNWYVEGFTKRSGIAVKVNIPGGLPRLTKEKEIALFRVVQEALTNVMRHSGSRTAEITVSFDAQAVSLTVRDEGKGMGRKRFASTRKREPGVGIMGMTERLQQLGGGLELRSLPAGTEVLAMVPIGDAPPVERPLTEDEILRMAKTPGYQEPVAQPGIEFGARLREEIAEPSLSAQITEAHAVAAPPVTAPPPTRKRVLIVDDHEVTRQGIRALLKDEIDIEICGEAKDGLEAILKARKLGPDLVIMDLSMSGGGGFKAATTIRESGMHAKILFFTAHHGREIDRLAHMAGFEGLVQKSDTARDLVRGIRALLDGKRFYGAQVISDEQA